MVAELTPPLDDARLAARRAIEALRSGVPNHDAVRALGAGTPAIEDRFVALLAEAHERGTEPLPQSGFLVAGNFGSGKSHLLEHLQQLALERNFVVSKVVISKETPLYDPAKLFRAAIAAARAPGRLGPALPQVAAALQASRGERYMDFYAWVQQSRELNGRFAASLYLHDHAQGDPELQERVLAFWSGDPIQIGELKRALKAQGERSTYTFDKIDPRGLAYQRFRFAARMILAAGYLGWVLLIDEAELIGRYSLPQRARSYAEIGRWTGSLRTEAYPGILSVFALTTDFERSVLDDRHDRENVPARLRATGRPADELIAANAERGIRMIAKPYRLPPPSRALIRRTYEHLRGLHGLAYAWEPPQVGSAPAATSTSMREYVRWWITEWDLTRLDPSYRPSLEVTHLTPDLSEDAEMEAPSEGSADPPTLPDGDATG